MNINQSPENEPGKNVSGETSPTRTKLHNQTSLGYVHLTVSDLQRSLDYYQRVIGLQVADISDGRASMGVSGQRMLILSEYPGAIKVPYRSGLYHFAILTPSRKALGKSLRNLIDSGAEIQGGADHLVSEAIYLADPDGNGIEIYRDRPKNEWQYEDGQLLMSTDPLDYQGLLAGTNGANGSWRGLEEGTRLGHIHLHVAQLAQAADFYEQVLGFDFVMEYMGSAAFLSTGGYHHHVGLNVWNGIGAAPNPPDAVGLRYFTINLTDQRELQLLVARLQGANYAYEQRESGLFLRDPAENGILIGYRNS
jgi:catechol 2,3-dioxygenase